VPSHHGYRSIGSDPAPPLRTCCGSCTGAAAGRRPVTAQGAELLPQTVIGCVHSNAGGVRTRRPLGWDGHAGPRCACRRAQSDGPDWLPIAVLLPHAVSAPGPRWAGCQLDEAGRSALLGVRTRPVVGGIVAGIGRFVGALVDGVWHVGWKTRRASWRGHCGRIERLRPTARSVAADALPALSSWTSAIPTTPKTKTE